MFLSFRAVWLGLPLCLLVANAPSASELPLVTVANGIDEVLVPSRADQDGILTVRDNTLYVQCVNRATVPAWRCEAAGLEGEPWLRNVLTVEHQRQLIARGFKPDSSTGNFVRNFRRTTPPAEMAMSLMAVLTEIYGAQDDDIDAIAEWLPAAPCHPRIIAGRDFGGSIKTPKWGHKKDVAANCGIATNTDDLNRDDFKTPPPGMPADGEIDLDARYFRDDTATQTAGKRPETYLGDF